MHEIKSESNITLKDGQIIENYLHLYFSQIKDIPNNITFKNRGHVIFFTDTIIPKNTIFKNDGDVIINSKILNSNIIFNNKRHILLIKNIDLNELSYNELKIIYNKLTDYAPSRYLIKKDLLPILREKQLDIIL